MSPMKTELYSCKYSPSIQNFILLNMNEGVSERLPSSIELSICSAVRNILQRGKPVSQASIFLYKELGDNLGKETYCLATEKLTNWTRTIKGDPLSGYNPAREFFDTILPDYLDDRMCLRNLVLPEAKMQDILPSRANEFWDQQVDFYIPSIKTVVEIDGSSHRSEVQAAKDKYRDEALLADNIEIVRITTKEIEERSSSLQEKLEAIESRVQGNLTYSKYMDDYLESSGGEYDNTCLKYDAIMRFQMLILSSITNGTLPLDTPSWKIQIARTDFDYAEECFSLAAADLRIWFTHFSRLLKLDIKIPEVEFVDYWDDPDISIDFSLFSTYDDQHDLDPVCVYIRNDYYDQADYYEVACAQKLDYKLNIDKSDSDSDRKTLEFFLKNIFFREKAVMEDQCGAEVEFRDGQLPIIENILRGNDTIGIMPTGGGKSLCYQLCSFLQPGITLIVVPIIALMKDQIKELNNDRINRLDSISSRDSGKEKDKKLEQFSKGKFQFLFISPERFQNKEFRSQIMEISAYRGVVLSVIDEVHCLSEWGHDFRASYLQLVHHLRTYCNGSTIVGLTATASKAVLEDLKAEFGFIDSANIKALDDVMRDELIFRRQKVDTRNDKVYEIKKVLSQIQQEGFPGADIFDKNGSDSICGLIFSPTAGGRSKDCCNSLFTALSSDPHLRGKVSKFTGQLSEAEKDSAQTSFMDNQTLLMICTKAFGMGINKPNVRYTIHAALPQSMESFYQEAGRAGRTKDTSYCYILYTPDTATRQEIDEFFSPNTTHSRRVEMREEDSFSSSDLETIMFLFDSERDDVDGEFAYIRSILLQLYRLKMNNRPTILPFQNSKGNDELRKIQYALHKLFVLGIVTDWTIDYLSLSRGSISVENFHFSDDGADEEKRLLSYIRKYDPLFDLNNPENERYQRVYEEYREKPIQALLRILIEWTNEHIVYSRLQSTRNMREICSPHESDEAFRQSIRDYFKYTDETIRFDNIVEQPAAFIRWMDLLYKGTYAADKSIIEIDEATAAVGALRRYLETYQNNPGLNYLCGMLRLYVDDYEESEGEARLDAAFRTITMENGSFTKEQQESIFQETLSFAKNFDLKNKNYLSEILLTYYPEAAQTIQEALEDQASLLRIIQRNTQYLHEIVEEREKWLLTTMTR